MAETQPMNLQALCYTAAEDRQALAALVCAEGVAGAADLLVASTAAGDHSVTVAAGQAYVEGDDDPPAQGMYRVRNDGAETVQLPVGSGGGLNRIDTIVARVRDSEYSGLDNDWVLEVVAGTAGAAAGATGAAFDSTVLATAGSLPDNAIVLGYVRVLAADTLTSTIAANNMFDGRTVYKACGAPGMPYIDLSTTVGTNVGVATFTKLTLDTTVHIDADCFSVTASVVTILKPGLYDFTGASALLIGSGSSSGTKALRVGLNGSGTAVAADYTAISFDAGAEYLDRSMQCGRIMFPLAAGDTLTLYGYSETAETTDAASTRFTIRKVG